MINIVGFQTRCFVREEKKERIDRVKHTVYVKIINSNLV